MTMSGKEVIHKFLNDPHHITVDDCTKLLRDFGYDLKKGAGSHRVYHKENARAITVVAPHGARFIKSTYIKIIIKLLGLEDQNEH
jgi:predicted RNA binding protein YcfA (HicA-like mRNA interferase family)